jgi:hypothetical protein
MQKKVRIDYVMEKLGEGAEDCLDVTLDAEIAAKIMPEIQRGIKPCIETKVLANVIREISVLRGYDVGRIVTMTYVN